MSSLKEVYVPNLGNIDAATIIEIVEKDQVIAVDEALMTLESNKASMDIPSPFAGKLKS